MKKYVFLLLAATALAFTACSSDDVAEQAQQGAVPICLNASVDGNSQTRGFTSTSLYNNTKVYVWADMINLSDNIRTEYFKGWRLKATTSNGERLVLDQGSETKYFPATNALDMYAMVGNFSGFVINNQNSLPVSPGFIYHTVNTDQSTEADYYESDMLYGQVRDQEAVLAAVGVDLKLYHMMSRVRVVLIPGNGNSTNDAYGNTLMYTATVKLLDVETRAKFTPARQISMDNFALQATRAAMVELAPKGVDDDENYVSKHDISIATGVASYDSGNHITDNSYGDAIIPPQTIPAGKFIQVTLTDTGTDLTHDTFFRFDSDFTFESGKQYQFQLTLDRIGETYSIQPTITAWTSENANRPIDLVEQ